MSPRSDWCGLYLGLQSLPELWKRAGHGDNDEVGEDGQQNGSWGTRIQGVAVVQLASRPFTCSSTAEDCLSNCCGLLLICGICICSSDSCDLYLSSWSWFKLVWLVPVLIGVACTGSGLVWHVPEWQKSTWEWVGQAAEPGQAVMVWAWGRDPRNWSIEVFCSAARQFTHRFWLMCPAPEQQKSVDVGGKVQQQGQGWAGMVWTQKPERGIVLQAGRLLTVLASGACSCVSEVCWSWGRAQQWGQEQDAIAWV